MGVINAFTVRSLKIEMHFKGLRLSNGTAFVVQSEKGPLLITNRHNVTGRDNLTGKIISKEAAEPDTIVVWHNAKGRLGHWLRTEVKLFNGDMVEPRWIEHPILKERADLVALHFEERSDIDLFPYDISTNKVEVFIGPTDTVSVVGFPFGKSALGFAIWATGFVASDPTLDYENLPVLLIDCRSRPGQSGSPVIAYRGAFENVQYEDQTGAVNSGPVVRFIGIYSGRIHPDSDIGMVWKATAVRELVQMAEGKYRLNYGAWGRL